MRLGSIAATSHKLASQLRVLTAALAMNGMRPFLTMSPANSTPSGSTSIMRSLMEWAAVGVPRKNPIPSWDEMVGVGFADA